MHTPTRWIFSPANKDRANRLAEECAIPYLSAYLSLGRGITSFEELQSFICANPELTLDPFTLPDMPKAVQRLTKALDEEETIAVFGDYDCDGVCAVALLARYLEVRGGIVIPRLPDRQKEGYGISPAAVDELHAKGVTLIVTVDNGISAFEAAEKAHELGVDLIITDHHSPEEKFPHALAIVNPKRRDCTASYTDYCGTGVAFLLACAMENDDGTVLLEEFGDIVALATMGDVVSLAGENRSIVRRGLTAINTSPCAGVAALIKAAAIEGNALTVRDVVFKLVPRINAAGRMGSAEDALKLLLCEDEAQAYELASSLGQQNNERQELQKKTISEALRGVKNPHAPVLVLQGEGWHEGIIGIAAAKACEYFGKPVFVLTSEGEKTKGSVRSIEGFHVHKALCYCDDLLQYYGGHAMAGGLTMKTENIEKLRQRLEEYARKNEPDFPLLKIDTILKPKSVSLELLDAISLIAPFGAGNSEPIFAMRGLTLKTITPMGEGKHLRLTLEKDSVIISAAMFFTRPGEFPYIPGDTVDIAFTLSENFYKGERKLSIAVQAVRPHILLQDKLLSAIRRYEKFRWLGESFHLETGDIPDRIFCARIYKILQHIPNGWQNTAALCFRLKDDGSLGAKVLLSLDILREAGLIESVRGGACQLPQMTQKRDLMETPTMKQLNFSKAYMEE
ncbi:MAG: single-stranded-DNA-specific exonuclease RecJ [Oscillospiraceae bacterium]|nr:single-stranded-DNA-specific exonuclease RecJ [Oscillospiraceae bacterium]